MAIELSYERFNNGDDIVPWYSAEEVILNTGFANTLAGDDKITGVGPGRRPSIYDSGIINRGTLYTGEGNDMITGTYDATEYSLHNANYVSPPNNGRSPYRDNRGNFYYYPEDPNGPIPLPVNNYGIYNSGTIDTGDDNDTITGSNITQSGYLMNITLRHVGYTRSSVGIYNGGTIKTGEGADSLISDGEFMNGYYGQVLLEGGDDTITSYGVIYNNGEINTGSSDDIITSYGVIYNDSEINTGSGNDTITSYDVIYNGGKIDTASGNDFIIAREGFESGLNNSGSVVLGQGEDSLYGFGSGDFDGGGDVDTIELTFGSYTVGRVGAAVSFTKGSSVMITSEFEKLKAGSTTYDFISLTAGQIITVA